MATNRSYGKSQEIRPKRMRETTRDLNYHVCSNQLEDSTRKHITCYSCGDRGHLSQECPGWNVSLTATLGSSEDQLCLALNSYEKNVESRYQQDLMDGIITCLVCGEEGHYSCDCPMKDQEDKVICTLCSKSGHCRLWCCQQNKSKNRACTRCGEIGHTASTHGLSCSSCDEYHQHGECPMGKVTCLFCEGQDHYLSQCPLNSVFTTVCKYQREKFQAALRLALSKQGNTLSTSAKPSTGSPTPANPSTGSPTPVNPSTASPTPANTSTGSQVCKSGSAKQSAGKTPISQVECFSCGDEGHYSNMCPSKPGYKTKIPKVLAPSKSNPIVKRGSTTTRVLKTICLKCHEGHYANQCPQKSGATSANLSKESEESSTIPTSSNLCKELQEQGPSTAKHSSEVKPKSSVGCFSCGEVGHLARSCPLKHQGLMIAKCSPLVTVDNVPRRLLICFNCHEEGHYFDKCPQKRQKR
ncbi:unnamed protein product [Alopecurus aequalis]